MAEYWDRYWVKRANRRRFLGGAATAGAGAAGLALVGCGDDDDDGGEAGLATNTPSGAASPTAADPFANAKRGGTFKIDAAGDPPTLDPFGNLSFLTKGYASYVYSRLFKFKAGPGIAAANVKPVGDLASGSETSPDGLVYTIKLRNAKFHNVAPVSGRVVHTDDVKYSWGRATATTNTNAAQLAFVDKVEYVDATTLKFTLKAPNAAFQDILADTNLLFVVPKEAESGFDMTKTSIGSGPWMLDKYTPSQSITFNKNPEWYETGFPLMDKIELAIIPEYTNRLSQFLAGNTDLTGLVANDLVSTKDKIKDVQLYGEVAQLMSFFYFDSDPASPWNKDPRVKQAISMGIDRDAIMELGYNVKKLKEAGLKVNETWNNIIPAGMLRWWLDPKDAKMGEGAKYFKYDLAAAKKLLADAGYPDGFDAGTYQYTANRYGATFNSIAEANIGYLQQLGIKTQTEVQDYASKYITQTFVGNFKGIAFGYETPFPEGGSYPIRFFTNNPNNHSKITSDTVLTQLTADQQKETNEEKRRDIFHKIQIEHAKKMHYIPHQAGAGTAWTGFQPWVKGVEYQTTGYGLPTETYPYRWKNL